jgi:protein gp37
MVTNSKIEWCDHTFNPWVGCTKISPACDHCYAESWAKRAGRADLWTGSMPKRTTASNWKLPLKWNAAAQADGRRYRVFCASLADVFDNHVPAQWRSDLFKLIEATPNLDWLLLTKRIGNVKNLCGGVSAWPNVWLGATIANQEEADRDIPKLLATPAAIRFLSCEPLLGPIDLEYPTGLFPDGPRMCCDGRECACQGKPVDPPLLCGIDWVIGGGESGGKARPSDVLWFKSLRAQCAEYHVAFFMKQLTERGRKVPFESFPDYLQVREYPKQ